VAQLSIPSLHIIAAVAFVLLIGLAMSRLPPTFTNPFQYLPIEASFESSAMKSMTKSSVSSQITDKVRRDSGLFDRRSSDAHSTGPTRSSFSSGHSSDGSLASPIRDSGFDDQRRGSTSSRRSTYLAMGRPPREKRKRCRVTPEQLVQLETLFALEPSPTGTRRREISERLGMEERQTQIWFQNRSVKIFLFFPSSQWTSSF
jgi:hypothetical protein